MAVRTEITFRLPNSPGALTDVCRSLAAEHVGIAALTLDTTGRVRLVVDNHVRGLAMLRERYQQAESSEVLVLRLSNASGALAALLALVADAGVNVEYTYTGVGEHASGALVVLGVDDPIRAASVAGV